MRKSIALIFAASTLFLAGCCTAHHASKQWEYRQLEGAQTDAALNKLADQGWSVVSFTGTADGAVWYVLKRPKP